MQPFEDIALKRQQMQADQQAKDLHQQNLDAINNTHHGIVETLIAGQNPDLATKDDIGNIINQLQHIHLTNLLEANKPQEVKPMNITDSAAYVGDSIDKLGKQIMDKLEADTSGTDNAELIKAVQTAVNDMKTSSKGDNTAMAQAIKKLSDTVKKIDVKPVVHVDAPKVTVKAPAIDLSPITEALQAKDNDYDDDDGIDLDDFKAQDIDNSVKNMQYIGFLNPNGNWYIIENDVKGNKLRYVFGNSGYSEAFARASEYEYMLLDEAIHALSA